MNTLLRNWAGADKSLARLGRKQATATKLRIYSTHSPRSSLHFLARCCNFWKPIKKIQKIVRPTRSPRQSDLRVGRKMATFRLFFQSREQVVVRWGQIRRIGWVIKKMEAQVGHFLLGCSSQLHSLTFCGPLWHNICRPKVCFSSVMSINRRELRHLHHHRRTTWSGTVSWNNNCNHPKPFFFLHYQPFWQEPSYCGLQ